MKGETKTRMYLELYETRMRYLNNTRMKIWKHQTRMKPQSQTRMKVKKIRNSHGISK